MAALWDGVGSGVRELLDAGMEKAGELRHELLRQCARNEVSASKGGCVVPEGGFSWLFKNS